MAVRQVTAAQATKALDDWVRQLPAIDKVAMKAAVEVIEPAARRNMAQQPVPNRPGALEADPATLKLNYSRYPWMAGAEAGSKQFRQFKRYVGFGERGYIVGEAIKSTQVVAEKAVLEVLETRLKEELGG